MRNLSDELKNKKIDEHKLLDYGFIKEKNYYLYKTLICSNHFEIQVKINENEFNSQLIDLTNQEEYILVDVQNSIGEFVGNVRCEYENILQDIIAKCLVYNVFKSKQSLEITEYIYQKYGDELEHLWKNAPEDAIWRNKKNNKWYAVLLTIKENKLKIASDETIEIINLKYSKEKIKEIIDNQKIFPGYHMNKNNWITILLNGSVTNQEIFKLIDNSYNLTLK